MKEKIKKILQCCNIFIECPRIPEKEKDQMVVNIIESVLKRSVYGIEVEVLQEIFESLDYIPDEDNIHTNF